MNMVSLLLLAYFAVHCILLVLTFQMQDTSPRIWLVRALLVGMIYDNALLALGPWVINSAWYPMANYPRFMLHVVFLPFLTLFAWSAMKKTGVRIAAIRSGLIACWVWVVIAISWGLWHEVFMLELGPKTAFGHTRLTNMSPIPPLATIATNIIVLPMAAAVWRRAGWPWFFLGALFIFLVMGAVGSRPWGFVLGNGAEVVFVISLIATEKFLLQTEANHTSTPV